MEILEKLSFIFLPILLTALFASIIPRKLKERKKFNTAATVFRNKILTELTGFYPIDLGWNENEWPRIYQSIPNIKSAATEFRYFVTRKGAFDKAISEYNKYCGDNTANNVFVLGWPESMPGGKSKKDYMEQFENIVKHLLSFAKEK
jgi:hypothetical protein